MTDLEDATNSFAAELGALMTAVVDPSLAFEVVAPPGATRLKVGPAPFDASRGGFALIPLWRSCDSRELRVPPLQLKAEFAVELDRDRAYLQVANSAFGLWVCAAPGRSARPLFRIEYDRDKTIKPPAHVHFHSESAELAWIYGSAGRPLPRFDEVHFPVGGRRFRPTLEDVLMFLRAEGLFTDWLPGARRALRSSMEAWDRRQARATARAYPADAADVLRRMGWAVSPPGEGDDANLTGTQSQVEP